MVAVQLQPGTDARVHVVFELQAEPNKIKTKEAGRPIFDDIEVCRITFAGNKHTAPVFYAHEFADWYEDPIEGKRERTYAEKYNAEYMAFKNGAPEAASGTPLSELPFLTEGKRRELRAVHVHTAEALATLDGNNLKVLGMGGRELKDKAIAYLESAAKANDASHMSDELAALRAEVAALREGKTAEETVPATETEEAFKDFENDDLKNWLTEAGVEVQATWNRRTLLARAREVLDKQGKKKAA